MCPNLLNPFVLEYCLYWFFKLPLITLIAGIEAEHKPKTYSVKLDKQVKQIMTLMDIFDIVIW